MNTIPTVKKVGIPKDAERFLRKFLIIWHWKEYISARGLYPFFVRCQHSYTPTLHLYCTPSVFLQKEFRLSPVVSLFTQALNGETSYSAAYTHPKEQAKTKEEKKGRLLA